MNITSRNRANILIAVILGSSYLIFGEDCVSIVEAGMAWAMFRSFLELDLRVLCTTVLLVE